MVKGITTTGFEYVVDERKAKDWELVEIVARMQKADNDIKVFACVIDVIDFLIGEDQKERLKEHCRNLYGYADSEKITEEVFEIVKAARQTPELKNSSPSQPVSQTARTASSATLQNITKFTTTDPSQQVMPQPLPQDSGMGVVS